MNIQKKASLVILSLLFTFILNPFFVRDANAAGVLTFLAVRPDRMAQSVASVGYLIVLKEVSVGTDTSVKVSFPAGFTVSGATATVTGIPATYHGHTLTPLPGIGTATIASQDVTVPDTDLTTTNWYGFYINGVTNHSTPASYTFTVTTQASGPTAIDASASSVQIVSDNGAGTDADQIVVTASVAPTFTLALGSNSQSITTALGSIVSGTGVSATASTNAQAGYTVWLTSATSLGLTSTVTGTSIAYAGTAADATPSTLVAGTAGVVVDVNLTTNTSGALTIDPEFNGVGSGTDSGGTPNTSYQTIFSSTAPVGGVGDVATIVPRVAISATTKAATDYAQTFTVTGAGSF